MGSAKRAAAVIQIAHSLVIGVLDALHVIEAVVRKSRVGLQRSHVWPDSVKRASELHHFAEVAEPDRVAQ